MATICHVLRHNRHHRISEMFRSYSKTNKSVDIRNSFGRHTPLRVMAAIVAAVLLALPAYAGLQLCNKARVPAKVALAHIAGKTWESRGWWTVPPGTCTTLIAGPLDARYYYLYGTDGRSGTWSGGTNFCISAESTFSVAGRGNCAARGYDSKGFFEIDTQDRSDWKQSLSD